MKKFFLSAIFFLSVVGVLLPFSAAAKKLTSPFRVVWISDTHLGFYKSNQAFKDGRKSSLTAFHKGEMIAAVPGGICTIFP